MCFSVITGGKPGELSRETEQAVIRAGIAHLVLALGQLPRVLPLMSAAQREQISTAILNADLAIADAELKYAAVLRLISSCQGAPAR